MFQSRSEVIGTDSGGGKVGTIGKPLKQMHKGVNAEEKKDAAKRTPSFNPCGPQTGTNQFQLQMSMQSFLCVDV